MGQSRPSSERWTKVMARAIRTVHAYCAGLIDGEGCISISKVRRKVSSGDVVCDYWLSVIVVTKDNKLTPWLLGNYGGRTSVVTRDHASGVQKYNRWVIQSNRATKMLRELRPYLILKRDQCDLAIEFQNHRERHKWQNRTKDFEGVREAIFVKMKELKRAGVETKSPEPQKAVCDSPASE